MMELHPASSRIIDLVASLDDDHLPLPTPCGPASVGDLVDHLSMFATNFTQVAAKGLDEVTSSPPAAFDASNLGPGWRERIVAELTALADAWSPADAWEGTTWVGGMHLPAEVVGLIALDELVIHGWDLAASLGEPYDPPTHEVEAATRFVANFDAPRDGTLFGPIVEVDPDAGPLDRLLGLTGRDPRWTP